MDITVGVVALFWGCIWAAALQWTRFGQWIARRRTWLAVVVGVGGDLLIALLVLSLESWLIIVTIVSLSAVGIVIRSLANELQDTLDIVDGQ